MWSSLTSQSVHLNSVKPLKGLDEYRANCVAATRAALNAGAVVRAACPIDAGPLEAAGSVDGLAYVRCPRCRSLYLRDVAPPDAWARAVAEVSRSRHAMNGFHARLTAERAASVYQPKLSWIENTLRLQGRRDSNVLEVAVEPSDFTSLLTASAAVAAVSSAAEAVVSGGGASVDAAVLLEALDRSDDPPRLLNAVHSRLVPGGLIFVTALVATGFDVVSLGFRNRYLYPPDRANCFSLAGLEQLLQGAGFDLLEVSTPGVLDVQIVNSHVEEDPATPLSAFERQLVSSSAAAQSAFQGFLQEHHLSSFARLVGRKRA